MTVESFQVRSDNSYNDQVFDIFNHQNQLLVNLHSCEWLCNMLLLHACPQEICFEWKSFDGPKRAGTIFDSIG